MNTLKKLSSLIDNLSVIQKFADDLGGGVHKEKEFRFHLSELPPECDIVKPIIIKQGILKEIKDGDNVVAYCRIRMKQEPGKVPKYSLGVKNFQKNEESETEISKDTFDAFYPDNLEKPQEKKRYEINNWEIDEIDDGTIIAEQEYKNKQNLNDIPGHWKVI